ncbi:MAG: methyl-accepting chemotaxis protein [Bryobacteraceae bacterium]
MTINRQIAITCGTLVAFTALTGLISLEGFGRLAGYVEEITTDSLPGSISILRTESLVRELRGDIWKHIANSDAASKAELDNRIEDLKRRVYEELRHYQTTITTDEDRRAFAPIPGVFESYMQAWYASVPLSREGKTQEAAVQYHGQADPRYQELLRALKVETDMNLRDANTNSAAAVVASRTGGIIAAVGMLLAVAAGVLLALVVTRKLVRTLRSAAEQIDGGAQQMAAAASQVASASNTLAQDAAGQAASVEETSASAHEISVLTKKNAEATRHASELMERAIPIVAEVDSAHRELGASMTELQSSSEKMSRINRVIDEIAFQTNILALNAAVEAARAGEAGLGFAVVADEVRTLAARAADAARETSALIEESLRNAGESRVKLDKVLSAMAANNKIAHEVKVSVDEVNVSTQEQARGLEQIASGVVQIEQVTQRAAATAEESASASQQLAAQCQQLKVVAGQLTALVKG